jgi:uncharacterized integral membrane protein
MIQLQRSELEVYQGQFGEFTITPSDRTGVIIYRTGLLVAALSFALATWLVLLQGSTPTVLAALTGFYAVFCLALGISLLSIHIYLAVLHRLLQLFWVVGTITAIVLVVQSPEPLALYVYNHPISLLGVGFTFAALTGIYFKEAFCFNRLETKFLTPLVPMLLLGHLAGVLPPAWEQALLELWSVLLLCLLYVR